MTQFLWCRRNEIQEYNFASQLYFRKCRGPYNLINEILVAMNKKMSVGGIFCDLEEAFDLVNHRTLLDML